MLEKEASGGAGIRLVGLVKHWGATRALDGVDIDIAPGSFCVLLGPSGCGKSTTLRILAGLEQATQGQVFIDGQDVTSLPPSRRNIAMVFQNYALFPHLTVAENITFGLEVRKLARPERELRLSQTAQLLGLSELLERRPAQLSGGQQQRVALARALVARAKVCLMDEPLSNLDAKLRQSMRHELRELQRQLGLTVVYVTHDQAEAMSMADQVVLMNHGRVEQAGTPRELYDGPATTFAARFIGTPPMNLLALDERGAIAGSAVGTGLAAATLGLRPELVRLGEHDGIPAEALDTEYLGADAVLRCRVGTQDLLVRTPARGAPELSRALLLSWAPEDMHAFDADGRRLVLAATPAPEPARDH